jgi:hypothetical protein
MMGRRVMNCAGTETEGGEIQVQIDSESWVKENLLTMRERIHKRLPVEFVVEVLAAFTSHRISEREAMELLGIKRSRLHQLRKRWLRSSTNRAFRLCQRPGRTFHVLSDEVK